MQIEIDVTRRRLALAMACGALFGSNSGIRPALAALTPILVAGSVFSMLLKFLAIREGSLGSADIARELDEGLDIFPLLDLQSTQSTLVSPRYGHRPLTLPRPIRIDDRTAVMASGGRLNVVDQYGRPWIMTAPEAELLPFDGSAAPCPVSDYCRIRTNDDRDVTIASVAQHMGLSERDASNRFAPFFRREYRATRNQKSDIALVSAIDRSSGNLRVFPQATWG